MKGIREGEEVEKDRIRIVLLPSLPICAVTCEERARS